MSYISVLFFIVIYCIVLLFVNAAHFYFNKETSSISIAFSGILSFCEGYFIFEMSKLYVIIEL